MRPGTIPLSIPSREKTWLYVRLFGLVSLIFLTIYGSGQWLKAGAGGHPMYFEWERGIPFVPWMITVYFSLNLLFWLPLFALPIEKLKPFAWAMSASTVVAGFFFFFLPGELGFERPVAVPGYEGIFERLWAFDAPVNLFPSLHITYSTLCVLFVLSLPRTTRIRMVLFAWLGAIYASVLLVHQHHVADIAGGAVLAWLTFRWATRGEVSFALGRTPRTLGLN